MNVKKILLIMLFTTFLVNLTANEEVDSYVDQGIKSHDAGEYDKAIDYYKKALKIEPDNSLVQYEISLTYLYKGDYSEALKYSEMVIKKNDKHLLSAIINKGSCLDYLGRTQESIELFESAIKQYGDHYLLYYNLGINYYRIKDYLKAEEIINNAIRTNNNHASSHNLLSYIMSETNQKAKSILSLYYFLFLEPNSSRSKTAYDRLISNFTKTPGDANITINPNQLESGFLAADLALESFRILESTDDNFINNSESLFNILGEIKKDNRGFTWDFYVPFFYKIAQSEHLKTFCHYISQSTNEESVKWLTNNRDELEKFSLWLKES
ncbi:MAG: tetratricopeptide repeat protein [Spirochaetaceae bacterium]